VLSQRVDGLLADAADLLQRCEIFTPSTSCVRTVPSWQQVWSKLLATCNNLVHIIRLVARLFQQVHYSHDITICSKLVTTTGNKQCKQNLLTACEHISNKVFADL
jgi:hypothetical protein